MEPSPLPTPSAAPPNVSERSRIGITIPASAGDFVERAVLAERLGFDLVGAGEHVFFHGPTLSSFVALAAAGQATTRIALLTSVLLLPLYPAPIVAKMGATLANMTNGRFELGIGVGGEYPAEFDACGVDVRRRGVIANESLAQIRRLWAGETPSLAAHGPDVHLQPLPDRAPSIWVAGRGTAAMRRAAVHGDVWFPYLYTPERLAASVKVVAELSTNARVAAGSAPSTAAHVFTCCDTDAGAARRMAVEVLGAGYAQDFERHTTRYVAAGTPETCARRLREYIDAGATAVVIAQACPSDHVERNMRLLGEEVLPLLQQSQD